MTKKKFVLLGITIILFGMLTIGSGKGTEKTGQLWFSFMNWPAMDNSENFSNYEYGRDLLMSVEPNSFLMTEGGDNQVFGLLYFSEAENIRPDVDLYDEKGNIFPRLYGDFIGFIKEELDILRMIRNFQIYSTGRPVYMTWEREDFHRINLEGIRLKKALLLFELNEKAKKSPSPEIKNYFLTLAAVIKDRYQLDSLSQLELTVKNMIDEKTFSGQLRSGGNLFEQDFKEFGPWYLKRFGLLYKVTPIRYAALDALEDVGNLASEDELRELVGRNTKIKLSPEAFSILVGELIEEGHVKIVAENLIQLVKPYTVLFKPESPMMDLSSIEYWNYYKRSFLEVPFAKKWDVLSRSVFVNYFLGLNQAYLQIGSDIRYLSELEQDQAKKESLLRDAISINEAAFDFLVDTVEYQVDNSSLLAQIGNRMEKNGYEYKATRYWILAAKADLNYTWGYLKAAQGLLKMAEMSDESLDDKRKLVSEAIDWILLFQNQQKKQLQFNNASKEMIQNDKNLNTSREMLKRAYDELNETSS